MKLSLKLPLAVGLSLLLLLSAALFGTYRLNQSLDTYGTVVASNVDNERLISQTVELFKEQVQEWKDTLIRGKDPKSLEKHWSAFAKLETEVADKVNSLAGKLDEGETKSLVSKFAEAHRAMGVNYRKGFAAFSASGFDPAAGDTAVAGVDRAPTQMLEEASTTITRDSAAIAVEASAAGSRATMISLVVMALAFGFGIAVSLFITRQILRQLGADPSVATALAKAVAENQLDSEIQLRAGDTTSLMAQLNVMQINLANVVGEVRSGAEGVATASAQIAQGNQDLSQRTEEQASALEQTAASMEELSSTVKQNADNAKQANQLALSASTVAQKGGEVVGEVVTTMKGINESSKKISDIISVIDGIAFQTNILALNAAVEAARAGEQGRGFAVVASEVRSLAGRSAEAAKEIKSLIGTSVERVEQGTALVDQAGVTMSEVVSSIRRVTDIMGEISAASTEQSAGVSQVGEAVTQMDQVTQQNAALVEESAAAAESLKVQAQQLVQAVAVFNLGTGATRQLAAAPAPIDTRRVLPVAGPRAAVVPPRVAVARPAHKPRAAVAPPAKVATGADDEWTSF